MKRILLTILVLAFFSVPVFAQNNDDDCTETLSQLPESGGISLSLKKRLRLTCTGDTGDGSFSYTLADNLIDIDGMGLRTVEIYDNGDDLDNTSDVAITDSRGFTLLSASGNGANIDITGGGWVQLYTEDSAGNDFVQMLFKDSPPTITITGNTQVGPDFIIDLILVP